MLGDYHLVISPFHPVTWPYLVSLRLELVDHRGNLARVAEALREFPLGRLLGLGSSEVSSTLRTDGLNILHQDQAPTGFQHCTWTMVAEAVAVRELHRREKEHSLDEKYPEPRRCPAHGQGRYANDDKAYQRDKDAYDTARRLFHLAAADMAAVVCVLQRLFAGEEQRSPQLGSPKTQELRTEGELLQGLLATPTIDLEREMRSESSVPSVREGFSREELAKAVGGRRRTCEIRRLFELPYHAAFGGGSGAPFAMRYHAESRELRFAQEVDYPGATRLRTVFPPDVPHLAVATFQPAEHVLRVVPIPEEVRRTRSVMIEVAYDFRARGASVPGLSKGLVADVASIARDKGFNILSIINKTREFSVREERGKLRILAVRAESMESPGKDRQAIRREIERLAKDWREATGRADGTERPQRFSYVSISARCTRPAVHRLFISMNFRHPREPNLKALLTLACAKCGFEPVFAESYSDPATDYVLRKVAQCDGFLQILVEPKEEQSRRRTWLDFEYGASSGRNMPRMRLVDVSVRSYAKWQEIVDIDRDRFSREIDLSLGDREVRRAFQRAIREIGRRIGRG